MDKRLFTVIKKELKRVFTDRRLIFTTMILPALSLFLTYSLMGNMISSRFDDINTNMPDVVVINAPETFKTFERDSELSEMFKISHLNNLDTVELEKDNILNGETELLIIFEKDFDLLTKNYKNPNLERYYNRSEEYSSEARWNMDNTLEDYEKHLLGNRIGNHEHVNVFDLNRGVENDSIEDVQKSNGKGFSMIFPMLIAMFLFAGAMSVGADIIAGEKERGTMATLLVTPVKRETLALGKIIALGIIAIVSALSSFVGIIASLPSAGKMLSGNRVDLSSLQFGITEYSSLAAIMLTLVGVYVAIICLVSVMSKTIKEANTYMTPIYMLVMMSGFTTMYADGAIESWKFLVPVYGSVMALKNLFEFELTSTMLMYTCISSVLTAGIALYGIKIMFNNEKVMFSK